MDVKILADTVNTGSGMKDNKLKSKDFFNVKDDPYITFHSTKVVQTGPVTFDVHGTLPYVESRSQRPWSLLFLVREVVRARLKAQWHSTAKNTA